MSWKVNRTYSVLHLESGHKIVQIVQVCRSICCCCLSRNANVCSNDHRNFMFETFNSRWSQNCARFINLFIFGQSYHFMCKWRNNWNLLQCRWAMVIGRKTSVFQMSDDKMNEGVKLNRKLVVHFKFKLNRFYFCKNWTEKKMMRLYV